MKLKIVNGTVIDGSEAKAFKADVLVENDKIVKIGDCSAESADKVIDATGLIVAPGFIDFHTHSDFSVLYDGRAENRIHDGVTTDVCGNCGIGPAPVTDEHHDELLSYLKTRIVGNMNAELATHWHSYEEYVEYLDSKPVAINMVPLLAEGPVRIAVMGMCQDEPTAEEMDKMRDYVRAAMEAGCCGMSSGLIYLPGAAVKAPEMTELCKVVAAYDGVYSTHTRDEGDRHEAALLEAFDVSENSGVRLNISHLKRIGEKNAEHPEWLFEMFDKARARGIDITYDAYPYESGMTSLLAMLPPWAGKAGVDALTENLKKKDFQEKVFNDMKNGLPNWDGIYRSSQGFDGITILTTNIPENNWMECLTLKEIAEKLQVTEKEVFFKLLVDEHCRTLISRVVSSKKTVDYIGKHPECMVGSDSATLASDGPLAKGKPHMRGYGTHGKVFAHFVRELGTLTWEQAVRKMTGLEADVLRLDKRGYLKEGYFADITVFNPETIADQATFRNPHQFTKGIEYVLVNGEVALEKGVQTAARAGRALRRKVTKVK